MYEQKAADWGTQYLYTGQELDPLTGLYNYGARYYDPTMSMFLSVDPLTDSYPGWTPFHYVHNNPLKLVIRTRK